jgi:hypothetical protein
MVATMLEAQTANTAELAAVLPLTTEREDMRLQWISRLLSNPLVVSNDLMEPFARQVLTKVGGNGQVIVFLMEQLDLERFAVLTISVRIGNRMLPLVWQVEADAAKLGFDGQRPLLERVAGCLPERAVVLLAVHLSTAPEELFHWVRTRHWQYRFRLTGNLPVAVGRSAVTTTGDLVKDATLCFESNARLFESGVVTNIGVVRESGHEEPWMVAMDCPPTLAAVRDYGLRWGTEPIFADFRSQGFGLRKTQLQHAIRVDHLMLIMALAMYWCIHTGRQDAHCQPAVVEKEDNSPLVN